MRSEIPEKAVKQTSKSFPFTSSILLQQHQEKPIGMWILLKLNLTETPQIEKVKPKTIFREKMLNVEFLCHVSGRDPESDKKQWEKPHIYWVK